MPQGLVLQRVIRVLNYRGPIAVSPHLIQKTFVKSYPWLLFRKSLIILALTIWTNSKVSVSARSLPAGIAFSAAQLQHPTRVTTNKNVSSLIFPIFNIPKWVNQSKRRKGWTEEWWWLRPVANWKEIRCAILSSTSPVHQSVQVNNLFSTNTYTWYTTCNDDAPGTCSLILTMQLEVVQKSCGKMNLCTTWVIC